MASSTKLRVKVSQGGAGLIMKMSRPDFVVLFCLCLAPPGAAQTSPEVQSGHALARVHCAKCHSIDRVGASPMSIAPPFRDLHNVYPVESLEEALAEGIMTGHPDMPQFRFEPYQIKSLIAFLSSLE
jgi:mono/diheme cytochrome c family protein